MRRFEPGAVPRRNPGGWLELFTPSQPPPASPYDLIATDAALGGYIRKFVQEDSIISRVMPIVSGWQLVRDRWYARHTEAHAVPLWVNDFNGRRWFDYYESRTEHVVQLRITQYGRDYCQPLLDRRRHLGEPESAVIARLRFGLPTRASPPQITHELHAMLWPQVHTEHVRFMFTTLRNLQQVYRTKLHRRQLVRVSNILHQDIQSRAIIVGDEVRTQTQGEPPPLDCRVSPTDLAVIDNETG